MLAQVDCCNLVRKLENQTSSFVCTRDISQPTILTQSSVLTWRLLRNVKAS